MNNGKSDKSDVDGSSSGDGPAGGGLLSKAAGGGLLGRAGQPGSAGDQKPAAKEETIGGKKPADEDTRAAKRRALGHPDPDTIKMFAGQIPRRMEEAELRAVFEEFGSVYQLSILRDRVTGNSRGCCFVTFFTRKSALDAQNKLHNLRTLPGMHHPMQLKPADAENRSERKLFVGMVGKQADDEDVWSMFEKFGPIEECTLLRDAKKNSKGCAFVTFMSRTNAIAAIRGLHHSKTMEGCSAPLVVKFADSARDRMQRMPARPAVNNMSAGGGTGLMPLTGSNQQPLAANNAWNNNWTSNTQQQQPPLLQQNQQPPNMFNNNNNSNPLMNPQAMQLLQQLSNAASQLSSLASLAMPQAPPVQGSRFGAPPPSMQQQQGGFNSPAGALAGLLPMLQQAAAMTRPAGNSNFQQAPPPVNNMPNTNSMLNPGFANSSGNNPGTSFGGGATNYGGGTGSNGSFGGGGQGSANFTNNTPINTGAGFGPSGGGAFANAAPSGGGSAQTTADSSSPLGRQVEGPDGANLFIYNLPQQCNDADLADMFSPFGNVLSAKVFIDKVTGTSKCFGFVSYDNVPGAEAAIQGMNNFTIGQKRLRVQPKCSIKDMGNKQF